MPYVPLTLAQDDAPPLPPTEAPAVTQQPGGSATPIPANGDAPPPAGMPPFFMILLVAMGAMIFFSMAGQRKEKKKRASMLSAMKKGDKVNTIGGIIGTVVEIRDDDVVVKVDENANTRIRFTRSSIQTVVNSEGAGD